ncbi:hypothetical protein AAZX31_02G170700 [Glycine max]|uniref:uncharacterized protein n=1 Tax=Glycine max TaxID=3847 RepID=UPI0003DE9520|nr:uncharacterized protein LOC102669944 [Glycine max]XP_028209701.1 uncharacterized protein LOC114392684 isoform X1 [Glycine soja]XP_028209706.1 uncharacterized protein LOC114392684 isoform X1 [Glycine soja]XP_028209716.1 uncharacterized protein LOC114392684 isoform X1 [Glycine soja]XP_028209723.1 uncharacterized protein LOC114392684 isoform X1 [Glycine soja]KAH1261848.1 hypothetical protein GmHk_02G004613 [Glycine max]|eukprot:XP_006575243.1 uncharacterized protein LOC102669944 [Glycine max]
MVYQFGQVIERSIEEFTVKFLLYVLGCFLVPTFKEIVHEEIACSFGNPATYIRDFLVEGIKNYRRKITMEYSGCIYLLLILYAEHVLYGSIPRWTSLEELPTHYWNNKLLNKLAETIEREGGLGVMTVKVLAQTKYNEHSLMPNCVQDLSKRVNMLEGTATSQSWLLQYY